MDTRQADRETSPCRGSFLTPKKSCHTANRNKSTTANLSSKEEGHSFEKLMMQHRQAMAVKYCSTNLFDLLGSDIKFKSPAQLVRGDLYTPSREQ